jgi:hypothetical protein
MAAGAEAVRGRDAARSLIFVVEQDDDSAECVPACPVPLTVG